MDANYLIAIVILVLLVATYLYLAYRKGLFPFMSREIRRLVYEDTDSLKKTCQYWHGRKDGKEMQYYPTGELNRVRYWKGDVLHGPMTIYYRTGNVYVKAKYQKGACHKYTVYKENGELLTIKRYKQ